MFNSVLVCVFVVAALMFNGHLVCKNKEWVVLLDFIKPIDNTLKYKCSVKLSIQMSYSNCVLYQNTAAARTCDTATRSHGVASATTAAAGAECALCLDVMQQKDTGLPQKSMQC